MKKLNYNKLMNDNPTLYNRIVNQKGQTVSFYEHPTRGDEYPVIAVFEEEQQAFVTEFFDTDDFYTDSEYNPVLTVDGECINAFEAE